MIKADDYRKTSYRVVIVIDFRFLFTKTLHNDKTGFTQTHPPSPIQSEIPAKILYFKHKQSIHIYT